MDWRAAAGASIDVGLVRPALVVLCLGLLAAAGCSGSDSNSGDPNTATVAGVDANSDGVRDDVQTYIDQAYPGTSAQPTRDALRQYAKAAQSAMLNAGNAAVSLTHATERFRAIECLMAQRPTDFPTLLTDLRARILNTDARSKAYLQSDGQVTASVISLLPADQWLSACRPT